MFTMLPGMAAVNTRSTGAAAAAGGADPDADEPTRRERQRAQTRTEILGAARALVADGEEVNVRAVARAVGMTAPALYRYVDGIDDLHDLLGGRLYDELTTDLVAARDAVPAADQQGRLFAMARAFRVWALAHRHEYGLLFASPLTGARKDGGCTQEGGKRFGSLFAEGFAALWEQGRIDPDPDDLDPALLAALDRGDDKDFGLPEPARYLYVRQWSRLYGMVTLEAFGHLHWAMDDTQPLFEAMLADCAAELGPRDGGAALAQQQVGEAAAGDVQAD